MNGEPVVTEAELLRAHDITIIRREPCVCGTLVVQMLGEDERAAVSRHQDTIAHLLWRERVA